ncbi:hypothetical protein DL768_002939 [Monosporascus sp. mg162]|nr:hypothetical protein DL768_002939 [Monosporascus sp. mg162]
MPRRNIETGEDEVPAFGEPKRRKTDHNSHSTDLTHNNYTVGWVCALPKEQTAATAMLDQRHADLPKPSNDPNTYTLGSIGKHNIVIVCLPKGKIGTIPAATVAARMISTFPSVKFGLMVGIGGGIPPKVRLGDVVVGIPVRQFPGVVQWDSGKAKEGGSFERTGALDNPPTSLLTALTKLETVHELTGSKIPEYLDALTEKWPKLAPKYLRPASLEDVLFKADYGHINKSTADYEATLDTNDGDEEEESCRFCDRTNIIKRKPREMRVHYGLIASGNQVIKDATFRDKLNEDLGGNVLCVEMEAAGLINNFPCIVIRGICDYADSHKNKNWQEHAAGIAAAFAKELLEYVQPSDVDGERPVKNILQIREIVSRTEANLETVKSKLDTKEDFEILNWLTLIDYGPQHSDFLKRRQPGTGQWLLDSVEYQTWINMGKQTLFCPGIPGAGKTILTSIVVDDLSTKFRSDRNTVFAYIYCIFQRQDEQNIDNLLASLLKQLAQRQPILPSSLKKLYDQHKLERTRPLLEETSTVLQSVASMFSRVFIVVDALDECQASNGCRKRFLKEILTLRDKCGANIFATSRINDEIAEVFTGATYLKIHARDDDIGAYLNERMLLLRSDLFDEEIRNVVKKKIIKATDGMFLLAELHMNTLISLPTKGDIKDALEHITKGINGLDETYKLAMERIEDHGRGNRDLAKQILAWIVHARKPLSTLELRHALAVRPHLTNLDKDYLPSVNLLRPLCVGRKFPKQMTGLHLAAYFGVKKAVEGLLHKIVDIDSKDAEGQTPLWWAAKYGHEAIVQLLLNTGRVNADFVDNYYQTPLLLAAKNGHTAIVKLLLDTGKVDADFMANYCQTPLLLAAEKGHEAIVKLLLDTGRVDADWKNKYSGPTPLLLAAKNGHKAIVQLLLNTGRVNADFVDNYCETPLLLAAKNGHEAIVKLLLDTGKVDADFMDNYCQTPLLLAAEKGHEAIVKLLLDTGRVDANTNHEYSGPTPLFLAAEKGHKAIVKLLLDTGRVNADTNDKYFGPTPLLRAAENGHEAIVKLLLDTGRVNADFVDNYYQMPLLLAAKNGHKAIVRLLLDTAKVDVNSKDTDGRTPLFLRR